MLAPPCDTMFNARDSSPGRAVAARPWEAIGSGSRQGVGMNFDKQRRLVERLLERTRAGELVWQESIRPDVFQAAFQNSSVQIKSVDDGRFTEVHVSIVDAIGRIVDDFGRDGLDRDSPRQPGSWSRALEELYALARRSALRADDAIDSILAEIE